MENEWYSGSPDYYNLLMEENSDMIEEIAYEMKDFFESEAAVCEYGCTAEEKESYFKEVFEELLADEGEFQDEDPQEAKRAAQRAFLVSQRKLAFAMG
jgi:hypothetical protein